MHISSYRIVSSYRRCVVDFHTYRHRDLLILWGMQSDKKKAEPMYVEAILEGYYGGKRPIGARFWIKNSETDFSKKWMKKCDPAEAAEEAPVDEEAAAEQAEALEAANAKIAELEEAVEKAAESQKAVEEAAAKAYGDLQQKNKDLEAENTALKKSVEAFEKAAGGSGQK